MLYQKTITIPAATLVAAPYTDVIPLSRGVVNRIRVEFPAGVGELAGVLLKRDLHQVYPASEGEYISWEAGAVESAETYPLSQPPYELDIEGVNYDSLNAHTITIAIELTPASLTPQPSVTDRLRQALGL